MSSIVNRFRSKAKVDGKNRIFNLNDADIHDHYIIKHLIGKGSFSTVKMGVSKANKVPVAIKIVDKHSIDVKVESLKNEVNILMNLKHPNIVSLLDVFEVDEKVYLIIEFMSGGELFDRICTDYPNGYSEKQSSVIVKKCIEGVQYLHEMGIIHRDLKPENLLCSSADKENTEIKISDFGLAKIWAADRLVKTLCGSPNYVAPEVLTSGTKPHGYSFACDMWSIGVILYVLLCGFCPFYDECTPTLFAAITTATYQFPSPYWDAISEDARDLVRNLLVVDPKKRFTPEQALAHPWLINNTSEQPIPNIVDNMAQFKVERAYSSFVEQQ